MPPMLNDRTADPTHLFARDLKGALEAKTSEAKERWAEFENARRAAIEGGANLTKDAAKLKQLEGLHASYDVVAKEAEDLRERLDRIVLDLPRKGIVGDTPGAIFAKELERQGIDFKAVTTGGSIVPATFDELVRALPQRQLRLRNLVRVDTADADVVSYLQQTAFTNNAAPVASGALKPTSTITVQRVDQPVQVIAHTSEAVDRSLLMDASSLADFIDQQLVLGVLLSEEDQVVNGSGVAPNLRGILNTTGVLTQARATDPAVDAVYKAITQVRSQFYEPTAVLIHPTDAQNLRLAKNANGDYFFGSPNVDGANALFGLPVAISPVLPVGTAIVGDFGQASLWLREDARITWADTGLADVAGQELFSRNLLRARVEERCAFGVVRPPAFCAVTGL